MTVLRIGHIEIYTTDRRSMVGYLVGALGFADVARARTADVDTSLVRAGDLRLLISEGPATAGFLDGHGDGVADIAFVCADVDATRARAVRAGLRPAGPRAVAGFGSLRHSLLPEPVVPWIDAGYPLPDLPWIATGRHDGAPARHIWALDHIAVVLDAGDLADRAARYVDAFGFERYSGEFVEMANHAMDSVVVRNPSGSATFTFLEPVRGRGKGQLDAFLDRNAGPGVQHLAFLVEEIVPAVRDLRTRGVEFLSTPDAYYDALAGRLRDLTLDIPDLRDTGVLADRDRWGYLLQLFTRSPHPRNTLFYELVQRRGARGFGSANIRALYEAVERDRIVAE